MKGAEKFNPKRVAVLYDITQDELRALSENYKRVAGFSLGDVGAR